MLDKHSIQRRRVEQSSQSHDDRGPGRWKPILFFISVVLLGALTVMISTSSGIGLWYDTYSYFSGSANLTAGDGFSRTIAGGSHVPITHFPPLYSVLLSVFRRVGINLFSAARMINILSAGCTSFLIGYLVYRSTQRIPLSFITVSIVVFSETFLSTHVWALTEPLFFLIMLAGLCLIPIKRDTSSFEWWSVIASGFFFGLLPLSRYLGISIAGAAVLFMAILSLRRGRTARIQAAVFTMLAVLPIGVWFLRNIILTGNPADAPPLAWHPPDTDAWLLGSHTFLGYFLPDFLRERLSDQVTLCFSSVGIAVIVFLLGYATWQGFRGLLDKKKSTTIRAFLPLVMIAYCAQLLFSVFFVVRITPFDLRILSPLFILLVLQLILQIECFVRPYRVPAMIFTISLILFLAFEGLRANNLIRGYAADPPGFASQVWQSSPTLAYIRHFYEEPIYTNEVEGVYLLTGRTAYFIPTPYNPAADVTRQDYQDWLFSMRESLEEEDGRLVLFLQTEEKAASIENMEDLITGLVVEAEFSDGMIYRFPTMP